MPSVTRPRLQPLASVLQSMKVGLWTWDPESDVVAWDARMREICGRIEPLRRRGWVEEAIHPDDRERFLRGATLYRIRRPGGEVRWVVGVGCEYCDDAFASRLVVGALVDVTEQRAAENTLRDNIVGSITTSLAHTLNNMLAVVQPCLDMLTDVVEPEHHGMIGDALNASERAATLVKDLMVYSGQRMREPVVRLPISALADEVVRGCRRGFAAPIPIELISRTSVKIVCEPDALGHVLTNLLWNAHDALRMAQVPNPRIQMELDEVSRRGEPWVRIRVSDNGTGIPNHLREQAFEPFFTTKRGTSTGLGLTCSRTIVEAHGGEVAVAPGSGGGKLDVSLPVRPLPSRSTASAVAGPVAVDHASRRRVLVVDDEAPVRRVVSRFLERSGYEVHTVASAEEARERVRDASFDLVLLDRSMPGVGGAAVVEDLRAALPRARLFYFTGEFVPEEQAREVDGVVTKPVRGPDLLRTVRHALGH